MSIDIAGLVTMAGSIADELVGLPSITYAAWTGLDGWGANTYAITPVSIKAVVEKKNERVINRHGIEVTSGTQVIIPATVTISENDRITLPDSTTPPIVKIGGVVLSNGIPATEIWF